MLGYRISRRRRRIFELALGTDLHGVIDPSRLGARQFVARFGVRRRDVKIQGLKRGSSIIADLMPITVLNE
jgi:hypothetical protein